MLEAGRVDDVPTIAEMDAVTLMQCQLTCNIYSLIRAFLFRQFGGKI